MLKRRRNLTSQFATFGVLTNDYVDVVSAVILGATVSVAVVVVGF